LVEDIDFDPTNSISLEDDVIDTVDAITGGISLEDDDVDLLARISSRGPEEKQAVLKKGNWFHPDKVAARKAQVRAGKRVPGAVGSVSFNSPIVSKPSRTITRPPTFIPSSSPVSFMEETLKLRQMRQPVASVVSLAPTADITIAAESGAATAVKNYIMTKLDGASGLSVIKKFANRKSIMYGSVAAVGLATSISASKNKLKDQDRQL
jgi:hypothetical protein